ncbi:MAG TPA: VWA domain-containing protein, partial [Candidatus Paceibacterota bacterium]|nr:VWA domain-containing protein [Candidatus Paceibacterota bacterium]
WKHIVFADPEYFALFRPIIVLACIAFAVLVWRHFKAPPKTYGSRWRLLPSTAIWFLLLSSASAMVVSLARPYLRNPSSELRRGNVDIVAVLDRSISMNAADIRPTRLDAAKRELMNVATNILRPGDRIAFFAFGKDSTRNLYLTDDFSAFANCVEQVSFPKDLSTDETVWDTDFPNMLEDVYESLDAQDAWFAKHHGTHRVAPRKRIVFLISDGDDESGEAARLEKAVAEFRKRDLRVYAVGVGTARGVPLPSVLRGRRPTDYPDDIPAQFAGLVTRLNMRTLSHIADATGGASFSIDGGNTTATGFLTNAADANRSFIAAKTETINERNELWRYPLYAAIILLLLAIMLC